MLYQLNLISNNLVNSTSAVDHVYAVVDYVNAVLIKSVCEICEYMRIQHTGIDINITMEAIWKQLLPDVL